MSKYVISFEDNPWYQDECVGYYKCGEIPWWSAKKTDIKKLIPLDKELDEAYLQGKHDAEQDLARAAYKEAYQKGYEVGSHEATTLEYQQGLDDAWKALLRITGLNNTVRNNIFGMAGIDNILVMYTAQEAIAKICEHEEQQIRPLQDDGRRCGMNDERTVSADYESMYENAIHHLEEREEAINMLKKDLQEATARADYFEREKEKESHYLRGVIDGLKFSIRCNGVSGAEVQ